MGLSAAGIRFSPSCGLYRRRREHFGFMLVGGVEMRNADHAQAVLRRRGGDLVVNALADHAELVGAELLLGRLSARRVVQRKRDFAVEDEIDLVEALMEMRDG